MGFLNIIRRMALREKLSIREIMGAFDHSRIRDFILGGATKGVFADLRLPVLLSH